MNRGMNFRLVLAFLLVALMLTGVAQASWSGPYQTTAWANKKIKTVRYWHSYVVFPTTLAGVGPCYPVSATRRNARGQKTANVFACFLERYDGSKSWLVTMRTLRSPPYFKLSDR
jgi:hypothetical protein